MINYLATATLAITMIATAPKVPEWEHSYGKALEATRAGQDPLLVVLDNPNNDSARIEPALLSEDDASGENSQLLRPYRLCHVDVTTDYGKKVAQAFQAKSFPHVAIIDKTGSVVIFEKSGKISKDQWTQVLTSHQSGERPVVVSTDYSEVIEKPYCPNCQRSQF
jgi:hypothetical protein